MGPSSSSVTFSIDESAEKDFLVDLGRFGDLGGRTGEAAADAAAAAAFMVAAAETEERRLADRDRSCFFGSEDGS